MDIILVILIVVSAWGGGYFFGKRTAREEERQYQKHLELLLKEAHNGKDRILELEAKLQAAIDTLEQIVSMGPPDTGEDATLMREYAQDALAAVKEE